MADHLGQSATWRTAAAVAFEAPPPRLSVRPWASARVGVQPFFLSDGDFTNWIVHVGFWIGSDGGFGLDLVIPPSLHNRPRVKRLLDHLEASHG